MIVIDASGADRFDRTCRVIIDAFLAITITRYTHTQLIDRIWAVSHNLTAYDAAYLALAQALDAELLTMDSGLRKTDTKKKRRQA